MLLFPFTSSLSHLLLEQFRVLVGKRSHCKTVDVDQISNLRQFQTLISRNHVHSCIVDNNREIVFIQLRQESREILLLGLEGEIGHNVLYFAGGVEDGELLDCEL